MVVGEKGQDEKRGEMTGDARVVTCLRRVRPPWPDPNAVLRLLGSGLPADSRSPRVGSSVSASLTTRVTVFSVGCVWASGACEEVRVDTSGVTVAKGDLSAHPLTQPALSYQTQ